MSFGSVIKDIGETASGAIRSIGKAAPPIAYTAMAGSALLGAGNAIHHAMQVSNTEREIINRNPELAQYDNALVKDYFDVIKTYSPQAARNPLVAGALVRKMIEFGGVDHKLVQDLGSIESNHRINPGDQFGALMTAPYVSDWDKPVKP